MWSLFILRKKQVYMLQPLLKWALALAVSCAALSSLLPLFWWIKTNMDLPTLLVNLFHKIVGLRKRGKSRLRGHVPDTLCQVFFPAGFNWDTQRFLSLAGTCLNPFVYPAAGNSSFSVTHPLTPIHPNLWIRSSVARVSLENASKGKLSRWPESLSMPLSFQPLNRVAGTHLPT